MHVVLRGARFLRNVRAYFVYNSLWITTMQNDTLNWKRMQTNKFIISFMLLLLFIARLFCFLKWSGEKRKQKQVKQTELTVFYRVLFARVVYILRLGTSVLIQIVFSSSAAFSYSIVFPCADARSSTRLCLFIYLKLILAHKPGHSQVNLVEGQSPWTWVWHPACLLAIACLPAATLIAAAAGFSVMYIKFCSRFWYCLWHLHTGGHARMNKLACAHSTPLFYYYCSRARIVNR